MLGFRYGCFALEFKGRGTKSNRTCSWFAQFLLRKSIRIRMDIEFPRFSPKRMSQPVNERPVAHFTVKIVTTMKICCKVPPFHFSAKSCPNHRNVLKKLLKGGGGGQMPPTHSRGSRFCHYSMLLWHIRCHAGLWAIRLRVRPTTADKLTLPDCFITL